MTFSENNLEKLSVSLSASFCLLDSIYKNRALMLGEVVHVYSLSTEAETEDHLRVGVWDQRG